MTQRAAPLAFPQAFQDDDDDVAWALSTAEVQWKRGAYADALVWLQRAVDSALEGGRRIRAFQLQQQANALKVALEAGWTPVADAEPAAIEYEDGADPVTLDPFGSVAVDIELPPSEPAPAPEPVEPLDFTDDTELIDDVEELHDDDVEPVSVISEEELELQSEENSELDRLPTLPPMLAAAAIAEPAADETTEPDLEPAPDARRARPSEEPTAVGFSEQPSSERSELRIKADLRGQPESQAPESQTLTGIVHEPSLEAEAEEDTQRAQVEAYDPLPSSGPPTAKGGFLAPRESSPPPPPSEPSPRQAAGDSGPPTAPELNLPPELQPAPRLSKMPPELEGVSLASVRGLEDLPDESQAELAERAEIHQLAPDEEVSGFGLALVLEGNVALMPAIADVAAARAGRGELVFSQGHLAEGIPLRVVAGTGGARVAAWPASEFERAIADCPWVGDELKFVGDRFQALAGVCMGPMGESLDDMLRAMVIDRCEVRRLLPGEVIAEGKKPVRGMFVLGAGKIEITEGPGDDAAPKATLGPGDFVFPEGILQGTPAPAWARAGKDGALVLFAERMVAHELMVSVPPLLEIFAR